MFSSRFYLLLELTTYPAMEGVSGENWNSLFLLLTTKGGYTKTEVYNTPTKELLEYGVWLVKELEQQYTSQDR